MGDIFMGTNQEFKRVAVIISVAKMKSSVEACVEEVAGARTQHGLRSDARDGSLLLSVAASASIKVDSNNPHCPLSGLSMHKCHTLGQ